MKTPKIGDIVHVKMNTSKIYPAIITDLLTDTEVRALIFDSGQPWTVFLKHEHHREQNYWSWPEEEKPKECEHVVSFDFNGDHRCSKCHILLSRQIAKRAEELIDNINEIMNPNVRSFTQIEDQYAKIYHLIKKYKGIK